MRFLSASGGMRFAHGSRRFSRRGRKIATRFRPKFRRSLGQGRRPKFVSNSSGARNTITNGLPRFFDGSFPMRQPFRLAVTDQLALTAPTAGGVCNGEEIYRLNDMYDPRLSVGGPTYEYSTTLGNLYQWYQVEYVDLQFNFYAMTSNTLWVALMFQPPEAGYSLSGKSVYEITKDRQIQTIQLLQGPNVTNTYTQRVYLPHLSGLTKAQWNANYQELGAKWGASPSKTPWLRMGLFDPTGAAGANCQFTLTIVATGVAWARDQPLT